MIIVIIGLILSYIFLFHVITKEQLISTILKQPFK